MCAAAQAWPEDFARCLPATSPSLSRCSSSASRLVPLSVPASLSLRLSAVNLSVCLSLSRSLASLTIFLSPGTPDSSAGISKQNHFKPALVRIYGTAPVEAQELLRLHDSSVSLHRHRWFWCLVPISVKSLCCWLWYSVLRCTHLQYFVVGSD